MQCTTESTRLAFRQHPLASELKHIVRSQGGTPANLYNAYQDCSGSSLKQNGDPAAAGEIHCPYKNERDYALAEFFLTEKLSKGAVDRFLKDKRIVEPQEGVYSYSNADENIAERAGVSNFFDLYFEVNGVGVVEDRGERGVKFEVVVSAVVGMKFGVRVVLYHMFRNRGL